MDDRETIIEQLENILETRYAIEKATTIEEFRDSTSGLFYICPSNLRLAKHFNLNWDLAIADHQLGTLGLVSIFETRKRGQKKAQWAELHMEKLKTRVDWATYIRHLLASDPSRGDQMPFTVEFIIVAAHDASTFSFYDEVLRSVARRTAYLRHIGINFLPYHGGPEPFNDEDVRRAFCWLLHSTKEWYDSDDGSPKAPGDANNARRLVSMTLENYRLPGNRTLCLQDNASVHIVQGHNGSGKSSIVESLELVTTGHVERLDRELAGKVDGEKEKQQEYARIIRNRDSSDPARVTLNFEDRDSQDFLILPGNNNDYLAPDLFSTSFRLDQKVMDLLTEQQSAQRATIFLKAFFPEEEQIIRDSTNTEQEAEADRRRLAPITADIREARTILESLRTWQATGVVQSVHDFKRQLNEWLELRAKADLADLAMQIVNTLNKAQEKGWEFHEDGPEGVLKNFLLESADANALKEQLGNWSDRRDELEKSLIRLSEDQEENSSIEDSAARRIPKLRDRQVRILDTVGGWLFDKPVSGFGQSCREALANNQEQTLDEVVIGSPGWADELIDRMGDMVTACENLEFLTITPTWPTDSSPDEFDDALISHKRWREASEAAGRSFLNKISLDPSSAGQQMFLNDALNELMALFTPARWAYEDIRLSYDQEGNNLDFADDQDAVAANLRLNTAELNLFTIALFLLCARRVSNPLEMLILDDPLQNMDELTVTTLARGLTKIVRLWGKDWRLLLLLHSLNDLQRVRDEVPAAVYYLPWLSTSNQADDLAIEFDPDSTSSSKVQDLKDLIQEY